MRNPDLLRGVSLALCALAAAAVGTRAFSRPGSRLYILDHPNHRSLHTLPKPRSGGVAILFSITLAACLAAIGGLVGRDALPIALGTLLIAVVSFVDDRGDIPVRSRFAAHVLAAGVLIASGFSPHILHLPGGTLVPVSAGLGAVFALGFVVWMVNLYNFMDGIDGLAGGMAVIGFGTYALLGFRAGAVQLGVLCILISAAAGGFLIFNFPPSRIFMGDTGSSSLGFLAAATTLWAARLGAFPIWIGLLVFSPFVVDATVTLARRLLAGHRVWEAHRSHYYQRLVGLGWSHRRTVLCEYLLMGGVSATVLVMVPTSGQLQRIFAAGWFLLYAVLLGAVKGGEIRARKRAAQSSLGSPPPAHRLPSPPGAWL